MERTDEGAAARNGGGEAAQVAFEESAEIAKRAAGIVEDVGEEDAESEVGEGGEGRDDGFVGDDGRGGGLGIGGKPDKDDSERLDFRLGDMGGVFPNGGEMESGKCRGERNGGMPPRGIGGKNGKVVKMSVFLFEITIALGGAARTEPRPPKRKTGARWGCDGV